MQRAKRCHTHRDEKFYPPRQREALLKAPVKERDAPSLGPANRKTRFWKCPMEESIRCGFERRGAGRSLP